VFNKRQRKNEENEWNWEGRKIEQVNECKYLGYTFNEREMGCIWGIGERKWRRDFGRKMVIETVRGRDLGMEETRRGSEGRIQEK
jgi:hypothetical protein